MSRSRFGVLLGVCGVLSLFLAACGSGSSSSAPTTTAASDSATPATKSVIAIGNIGSYSGPEASSEAGGAGAIRAWVDWTNAHGGLDGHPVKVYVMDDALNGATSLSDVETLVQKDHVVAIVGELSDVDVDWASYVEKAGVPVIGGLGLEIPFLTNPDFYGIGNGAGSIYGSLEIAKQEGGSVAELYCLEAPICLQSSHIEEKLAKSLGVKVPLVLGISGSQPNYTAVCQAIKSKGVSAYDVGEASAIAEKVADSCVQQGVKAKLIETTGINGPSLLLQPGTRNMLESEMTAPFFDTAIPAIRTYRDALTQYAPSIPGSDLDNGFTFDAYAGGLLLSAAVQASNESTVTSSSVKAGLYALNGATLGGVTAPLTFTKGKPWRQTCYFEIGNVNGKFMTLNGGKTTCGPDSFAQELVTLSDPSGT